ncbi:hypothetical protein F5Y18DRAFT_246063 [Xylariaceae sp. FL1019]|nr:hypothetical protein F5Y18DRAFT_246063 [Xylariaceae sp. FL1019]
MWSGSRAVSRVESSASPTTTTSTGNRGGRPRDWTDARRRRYNRLFVYTYLGAEKILHLLEEDGFKPGKDAANKVKNGMLGNDPRWIRPKTDEEEESLVRALQNSLRGKFGRKRMPHQNAVKVDSDASSTRHREGASLGGTTIAHSIRSSFEEPSHADASWLETPSNGNWYGVGAGANATPAYRHEDAMDFTFSRPSHRDTSRQGTGLTMSTDISVSSIFKAKLADFTEARQKRIVRVFKQFTFPKTAESSPVTPNLDPSMDDDDSDSQMGAGHAVPGDFLRPSLLPRQQDCARYNVHPTDSPCWCRIADEVLPTQEVWNAPTFSCKLSVKDMFGNTIFHHRAALDRYHDSFLHDVYQALQDPNSTVHGKNSAGQTFLHVLHSSWFQPGSRLNELVNTLKEAYFDVLATDVYGRSFYHLLRRHQPESARFPSNQTLDHRRMNSRDAFGMRPMGTRDSRNLESLASPVPKMDRTETTSTLGSMRGIKRTPTLQTSFQTHQDKQWKMNADLIRIITSSINVDADCLKNSPLETALGQNGLHCLAEANINLSLTENSATVSPDTPTTRSKGQAKRKHQESEEVDTPQTRKRDEYLRSLINAGVDVNQYDANGITPLMAFVANSSDATKVEKEDGANVIKILVGEAHANMELRNRHGETALHVAAKTGKPMAVRTLLELGANPHTRNSLGLGVLEVVDRLYLTSERDDKSNARFEACRAILTRNDRGAKQKPTILDEWSLR